MTDPTYVLMTAARNEREHFGATLDSVRSQTLKTKLWVIVSDGSTDGTDELVLQRAQSETYIRLVRIEPHEHSDGFASKVAALSRAWEILKDGDSAFVGNLDADLSFDADYFERLLDHFAKRPRLGLAGGFIHEKQAGVFRSRPTNHFDYVAGAVQMFRRECFRDIGGFTPSRYGGEDTIALVKARMAGWEAESFPDLAVRHLKTGSAKRGRMRDSFREGAMFQTLGSHPLFEVLKCFRRIAYPPYVLGAGARLCGYLWPLLSGQQRIVSEEVTQYLRRQQMNRVRRLAVWHKSC